MYFTCCSLFYFTFLDNTEVMTSNGAVTMVLHSNYPNYQCICPSQSKSRSFFSASHSISVQSSYNNSVPKIQHSHHFTSSQSLKSILLIGTTALGTSQICSLSPHDFSAWKLCYSTIVKCTCSVQLHINNTNHRKLTARGCFCKSISENYN